MPLLPEGVSAFWLRPTGERGPEYDSTVSN